MVARLNFVWWAVKYEGWIVPKGGCVLEGGGVYLVAAA